MMVEVSIVINGKTFTGYIDKIDAYTNTSEHDTLNLKVAFYEKDIVEKIWEAYQCEKLRI